MTQDTLEPGARIAIYDDLLSSPRIVEIPAAALPDHIDHIAAQTYELSHAQGGSLPYTVIREIAENFIHAGFCECTVSILDKGDTLCFSDQGPGITRKDLVVKPGFTSATTEMKRYIRGVGSGLPIAREYLQTARGSLLIEDNAVNGTVVTISVALKTSRPSSFHEISPPLDTPSNLHQSYISPQTTDSFASAYSSPPPSLAPTGSTTPLSVASSSSPPASPHVRLNPREKAALLLLFERGTLGSGDLVEPLHISAPTATRLLQDLESYGYVETSLRRKRILSNAGLTYVQNLL